MKKESVKKDDYELYSFPMPFLLKRSRRKNYIAKKLEQLHPCFSDSCCYDAKYRLQKGKLVAAVAVMDKLKLAEYKSGANKHASLKFGEKNKLEFFNSEKILNISLALAVAALLGILGASYAIHSKAKRYPQANANPVQSEGKMPNADLSIQQNILLSYSALDDFLQSTKEAGGAVKSCSLIFLEDKNSDESYKLNFSMSECFPEEFLKAEESGQNEKRLFSAVTYSDAKPEFQASVYNKATNVITFAQKLSKPQIDDIRLAIWENNGILITDFSDEGTVEFLFQNTAMENILLRLKNICDAHSIFPAAIEIEGGKINSQMKIIFAQKIKSEDTNPLALLNRYSDVFAPKGAPQQAAQKAATQTQNTVRAGEKPTGRESFGKIIQKDGTVLVFYKNSQGKITGEKQ